MLKRLRAHWKTFLFLPPILVAIALFGLAVKSKTIPERLDIKEQATSVRVIEVKPMALVPRAIGYGTVEPGRSWEAVAEVQGRVVYVNPRLKEGNILEAGEVIILVDPRDYELAISQLDAQLQELVVQEKNTRALLVIEERTATLAKKELERKIKLLKKGSSTQTSVDTAERTVIASRQATQSHRNILALIPTSRQVLLDKLEIARLDLARCEIVTPFALRISKTQTELAQYISKGKVIATGDGIESADITAQLSLDKMISLIDPKHSENASRSKITSQLPKMMGLTAEVRLRTGEHTLTWPAQLSRIKQTIDPNTRTIGIVVTVDKPYAMARPGIRPPLTRNMFVEVELRGSPKQDQLVIPRTALHGRNVYILNAQNRLTRQKVEIAFFQGHMAILESGLEQGMILIVSDLIPAVDDMLLDPIPDAQVITDLQKAASGEGTLK
jgi:RND family efflux transporter MFP subunit